MGGKYSVDEALVRKKTEIFLCQPWPLDEYGFIYLMKFFGFVYTHFDGTWPGAPFPILQNWVSL